MECQWIKAFGPESTLQGDPIRGYWCLHVPHEKVLKVWTKIKNLTEAGELGYLASKCTQPMTLGIDAGEYAMCAFAIAGEEDSLLEKLKEVGLSKYCTHEWKLLRKFREDLFGNEFSEYSADGFCEYD